MTSPRHLLCAFALILMLSAEGCTGWHAERLGPRAVPARNPETIRVTRSDSSRIVLRDPELQGDTLVGTGRHGVEARVPVDSVRLVETRRLNFANTFAVFVGLLGLAVIVVVAVAPAP